MRCVRDVHQCAPGRMLSSVLASAIKALSPYVTIWFSAQLIAELSGLRRPEVPTRWAVLTVCLSALMALLSALAERWEAYTAEIQHPCKEKLMTQKFFHMDYADLDDQNVGDQYSQIRQNENWQGWGVNQAIACIHDVLQSAFGILGAVALTISLFTTQVPQGAYDWLNSPLIALALLGMMLFLIWFATSRQAILDQKLPAFQKMRLLETVYILPFFI